MTIAIVMAVSACIPLEPSPPDISAGPSGLPGAVTCDGPFGKDASHESVAAKFGASNVVYEGTALQDGIEEATILYPNDPIRRLVIFWFDSDKRSRTAEIHISDKSKWTAGPQLRLGLSLKQVEAVNGKPFRLRDFHSIDYDGLVKDWRGGALDWIRNNGCELSAVFAADGKPRDPKEDTVLSNDPGLRPAKARLTWIALKYPRGE